MLVEQDTWQPLADAIPDVPVPDEAKPLQIESGLVTSGTRRLVESAIDSYERSTRFYGALVDAAPALEEQLHQPAEGETVGLLVSDRHDNIGMDAVARAVADQGGATFLLDAGDDTSTGGSWEAFSLESLDQAFADFDDRVEVAGNHDNGDFVTTQARRLGFTTLDGKVVDGPAGMRLLGVADPRSSGLGTWRDERGISFDDSGAADRRRRLRARRRRRPGHHPAGARREQRPAGPQRGLRGPGAGRPPARAGRADRDDRHERQGRLLLHQRHDRWGGVRPGHRQQAAPRRRGDAGDLPRRGAGRGCSR